MGEDDTTPRTLWTRAPLDMLEAAIKRKRDKETLGVLKEFRAKGYGKAQIPNCANKHMTPEDAKILKRMIGSLGPKAESEFIRTDTETAPTRTPEYAA